MPRSQNLLAAIILCGFAAMASGAMASEPEPAHAAYLRRNEPILGRLFEVALSDVEGECVARTVRASEQEQATRRHEL